MKFLTPVMIVIMLFAAIVTTQAAKPMVKQFTITACDLEDTTFVVVEATQGDKKVHAEVWYPPYNPDDFAALTGKTVKGATLEAAVIAAVKERKK